MLIKIRQKAMTWFAKLLIILFVGAFGLWGINNFFTEQGNVNVAVVDGAEIDLYRYQNELNQRQENLRRQLGQNIDPELLSTPSFRQGVLDDLIGQVLLSNDAQEQGYQIGDQQLAQTIQQTEFFHSDGRFDPEVYEQALRSAGYTKGRYEELQRQQLPLSQIQRSFAETAFVIEQDLNETLKLAEQTRTADYVVVDHARFLEDVSVDALEIEKEYNDNADNYRASARMKVNYIELSVDALADEIELTDEDLRRAYDENSDQYTEPEQRSASHILVKLAQDADDAAQQEALEKAQSLTEQARSGADFAELAKENSDDAGSAANGGDLELISPGAMVKPFEDAVFALELDKVSDPVKSRFGYHVIKLTAYEAAKQKPFEDAREELLQNEKRLRSENRFAELVEIFQNLVYENPESLDIAATDGELDLEIKESDWFTLNQGAGIAENPRVRTTAFSDDVLVDDLNSEAIEHSDDRVVALHKLEYEDSRLKSLDEVREQIEDGLKVQKAKEQAVQFGQQLLEKLNSGNAWDDIIEESELQAQVMPALQREAGAQPVRQISEVVFAAPVADESSPGYGGVELDNGEYALYRLTGVADADPETVNEGRKEQIRTAMVQRWGQDSYALYQQELRNSAEIKTFPDQL